jgi:hypothetical protein
MGNNQYLVTSGGNPNYGVELIVAYWLCFLAPIGRDPSVRLDCPQPGTTSVSSLAFILAFRL